MKLIDVLVMISKGELKEGTKVKYTNYSDFELKFSNFELRTEDNEIYFCSCEEFNEEVELIEPEQIHKCTKKIEELNIELKDVYVGFKDSDAQVVADIITAVLKTRTKLNEVIHYINKNGSQEKINIKPKCDHNWIPTCCDWTGSYIECKCTKCGEIKNYRRDE